MNWVPFHHPDWSLPVVRRKVAEEWIDLMSDVGELLASGGRSIIWKSTYPNRSAYNNAMYRLKTAGLVVRSDRSGRLPVLTLTEEGRRRLPVYYRPEREWNSTWNGIWYVLMFDVPEKERYYRDSLRRFLKRLRMGCLQKSVWVTPRDIRPECSDLEKTANVNAVSYLLESRTVLHRETAELVRDAWDFKHLQELHERYLQTYTDNLQLLAELHCKSDDVMALLYQEAEAYVQCMRPDPLLPGKLLPKGYLGKKVFCLHQSLRKSVAKALLSNPS